MWKLISAISKLLSANSKRKVIKLQTILIASLIPFCLLDIGLNLLTTYPDESLKTLLPSGSNLLAISRVIYATIAAIYGALPMQVSLYYYCLQVICLQLLNGDFFASKMAAKNAQQARKYWDRIACLKWQFEETFSVFPLLWFLNAFSKSVVFVLKVKVSGSEVTKVENCIDLWWFLSETFYTACVPCIITAANENAQKLYHAHRSNLIQQSAQQSDTVINHNQADNQRKLDQEVRDSLQLQLTAWSLFALNKSLLVNFAAGLVSFSVLFMQLTN